MAGSTLSDISFVSSDLGFGLPGPAAPAGYAAVTHDGGANWTLTGGALALPEGPTSPPSVRIRFADASHGWVYGTGILTTTDGAAHWAATLPGWTVTALSALGPSVWALTTGDTGHPPDDRLAVSVDWGTTWSISPVPPQLAGGLGVLDRLSPTVAYAMGTGHATAEPGLDHIAHTTDGAHTWSYLPDPCATGPEAATRLQVLPPATVWLACAGGATAGYQAKSVYRSRDSGRHWTLAARACFPASGCTPAGQLPAPGYLVIRR